MPARETNQTEESDGERGEVITGKRAEQTRSRADKFVGETEESITDQVKMEMLAGERGQAARRRAR